MVVLKHGQEPPIHALEKTRNVSWKRHAGLYSLIQQAERSRKAGDYTPIVREENLFNGTEFCVNSM